MICRPQLSLYGFCRLDVVVVAQNVISLKEWRAHLYIRVWRINHSIHKKWLWFGY